MPSTFKDVAHGGNDTAMLAIDRMRLVCLTVVLTYVLLR